MGIAVLASGTGSILEAILEAHIPVAVVVADRDCRALEVAASNGVEAVLVDRKEFGGFGKNFDRNAYTDEVVKALAPFTPTLITTPGFGTILSSSLLDAYPGRVINTHPSLLPAFKGWHAVEDALAYGVKITGCTVHIATEEVDSGPILAQEAVEVRPDDTVESLHERIKQVERRLVPRTIKEMLEDR